MQASAKVLNIFRRYSKLCERASIDEAYLDVSEQVIDVHELYLRQSDRLRVLIVIFELGWIIINYLICCDDGDPGQVEEMLEKAIDWEGELRRLLEPAGGSGSTSEGVPVMLIEGGSLAVYNAYDRRYDSCQCVCQFSHQSAKASRCVQLTMLTCAWTEQITSRCHNCRPDASVCPK